MPSLVEDCILPFQFGSNVRHPVLSLPVKRPLESQQHKVSVVELA
jgi:hypothetical protein